MDNAMGGVTGRIILMHKRMATHAMYVRLCRGSLPRSRGSSASVRRVAPYHRPRRNSLRHCEDRGTNSQYRQGPIRDLAFPRHGPPRNPLEKKYTCMPLIHLVCIMHTIYGQQRMLTPDMCTAAKHYILYTNQPDRE